MKIKKSVIFGQYSGETATEANDTKPEKEEKNNDINNNRNFHQPSGTIPVSQFSTQEETKVIDLAQHASRSQTPTFDDLAELFKICPFAVSSGSENTVFCQILPSSCFNEVSHAKLSIVIIF